MSIDHIFRSIDHAESFAGGVRRFRPDKRPPISRINRMRRPQAERKRLKRNLPRYGIAGA
jgi:hypothetical protein